MKHSKSLPFVLLIMFAAVVSVESAAPVIEVGSKAPELDLTAADGERRSLTEVDGPTVLVFYRGLW